MHKPHSSRRRVTWLAAGAVAATAVAAFVAPPASAQGARPVPTPEERAAALARPSVVYIETHWSGYVFDEDGILFNNREPITFGSRCTGFVVDPSGYIATAGHCVDHTVEHGAGGTFLEIAVAEALRDGTYNTNDPNELYEFAKLNWRVEGNAPGTRADKQIFVQRGTATGGKTDGEALPARLVDYRGSEAGDVALLKVEKGDLPSIEVATGSEPGIGTSILSIGYPGATDQVTDTNLEPTNKDGKISARKTVGTIAYFETSAALSGGMSGGPTVDLDGRVLGVNSWKLIASDAFNYIAPASNLNEILSRNGVKNSLGPQDVTYRAGLEAYWSGRYTDAITAFDKVVSIIPSHQQAQEYRQKAAKDREQFGDVVVTPAAVKDDGGLPIAAIGGGVLLLVIVAGAGVFLTTRKSKAAPAADPAVGGWGNPAPQANPPVPAYGQTPPAPEPAPAPMPADAVIDLRDDVTPMPMIPAQGVSELDEPVVAARANGASPSRARKAAPKAAGKAAPRAAARPAAATRAAFCANCGTERMPGAAFCAGCGTPLG